MSATDPLATLARSLRQTAQDRRHRYTLVFSGTQVWCRCSALRALAALDNTSQTRVWLGQNPPAGFIHHQARQLLGHEFEVVVIDAYSGFDPDAFGAITGTLSGGGLLLLLCPPDWPAFNDPEYRRITVYPYAGENSLPGRFLRRLQKLIRQADGVTFISENQPLPVLADKPPPPPPPPPESPTGQQSAIDAIIRVVRGHRRRPLVITADRGRGKSAALGMAAAALLQDGIEMILLTAPRLAAVERVFHHAHALLPDARLQRSKLSWRKRSLQFIAPDELLRSPRAAGLLLIDEAAAIPSAILSELLQRYSRIVFATTVHGYEGNGRGFALRFQPVLDKSTPGWKLHHLETPIRWARADPLERWTARALLLNTVPATTDSIRAATPDQCVFEHVSRDRLAEDQTALGELFGLLVLAHYRTRPYDLRHLLDGPNLSVSILRFRQRIVGVAVVAAEGGLPVELAREICAGKRRLQGHLLAQSLGVHCGIATAPRLRYARIMRIAIHPGVQRKKLGTHLLHQLIEQFEHQAVDITGASFAASPDVLRFWQRLGWRAVRIGSGKEAGSGQHSVLTIAPLSEAGHSVCDQARRHFSALLAPLLADADTLCQLDPELALALLQQTRQPAASFSAAEREQLLAFAKGERNFTDALAVLCKLALIVLSGPELAGRLDTDTKTVLLVKLIQKRSWQETAAVSQAPGREAMIRQLRSAVQNIVPSLYRKI